MIQTYFTDPIAPATSLFVTGGLIASAVIIVIGLLTPIFLHIIRRKEKPVWVLWRNFGAVARLAGLVYLILFFLRYQGLYPFNYRGWVFVALIPFVTWTIILIRRYLAIKPQLKEEAQLYNRFHKYLPQSKR